MKNGLVGWPRPLEFLQLLFPAHCNQAAYESFDLPVQVRAVLCCRRSVVGAVYGFQLLRGLDGIRRRKITHRPFQRMGHHGQGLAVLSRNGIPNLGQQLRAICMEKGHKLFQELSVAADSFQDFIPVKDFVPAFRPLARTPVPIAFERLLQSLLPDRFGSLRLKSVKASRMPRDNNIQRREQEWGNTDDRLRPEASGGSSRVDASTGYAASPELAAGIPSR